MRVSLKDDGGGSCGTGCISSSLVACRGDGEGTNYVDLVLYGAE